MSRIGTLGLAIAVLLVVFAILKITTDFMPGGVWIEGRSLDHWINAAAGGSNDARAVLEKLEPKYIPALCRRTAILPLERFWERLATKIPPFHRLVPDQSKLTWRQTAVLGALRQNTNWGEHTATILKTACAVPNNGFSGRAEYEASSLVATASFRVRRDPDRLRTSGIITEFGSALTNRSLSVQYGAICALGNFGQTTDNWLPEIRKKYDSYGRTLAQHAARATWRISGERQEPLTILLLGLTSKEHDVYNWTTTYLEEMAPGSLPPIPPQKVLAEDNPEVRGGRKLRGLPASSGPGGPLAHRIIEQLQKSEDIELAEAAVEAARRLREAASSAQPSQSASK